MRPGSSTEPIWRTRIKAEWDTPADVLAVWVILEEFDTDDSWLGMRVLDQNGHWREWITEEGESLGAPTQMLPAAPLTRTTVPTAPKLTTAALDSMRKALEKTEESGSPLVVSPSVREWIDSHAIEMEREFLFGKGVIESTFGKDGLFRQEYP